MDKYEEEFIFSDILTAEERLNIRVTAFNQLKKMHIQDLFINIFCFVWYLIVAVVLYIDFLLVLFSPAVLILAIYNFGVNFPNFIDWMITLTSVLLIYKVNFKMLEKFPYIKNVDDKIKYSKNFIKCFSLAIKSNSELRDTGKLKWHSGYSYISFLDEFYPNVDKLYMRCSFPVEYYPYVETDGVWYNVSYKEVIGGVQP